MATEENSQNPFTRPAFIIAAVVVGVILTLGIVLAAVNMNRSEPEAAPSPPASAAPSTPAPTTLSPTEDDASVCGLDGEVLSGSISTAPETEWKYQDVYAYPSSPAGPADTSPEGYRFCFQHSPEGALLAAANITISSFDATGRADWLEYVVSEGQHRTDLVESGESTSLPTDVRASIAGFRMLAYEGDSARVDIAFRGTSQGTEVAGSLVAELVWEGGDWKLDASNPNPARITELPNLAGYTSWTER